MNKCSIVNPIPKQLIGRVALLWSIASASPFCNALKADPTGWPSALGPVVKVECSSPLMQLSCFGSVQISLDQNGEALVTPKMLLSDPYANAAVCKVVVNQTGKNKVYCTDVGKSLTATVIDTTTGMMCWSTLIVEDKLSPTITCAADTVSCANNPFALDYTQFVQTADNCDTAVLTLADMQLEYYDCLYPRYSMVVHLKWIATDDHGNSSICVQDIYFKKASVDSVNFPPNDTVYCPDPDLTATGVPTLFGDTLSHLCNLVATHSDDSIPVCGGMIKIRRTWTAIDWCTRAMRSELQEILVSDTTDPVIVCPRDTTLYLKYNSCTSAYRIPTPAATDACSPSATLLYAVRVDSSYIAIPGSTITLNPGTHTLDYIAFDPCGNSDTCSAKVHVLDKISPTLVCPPGLVVSLDPAGMVIITADFIASRGLVTDNCCIDDVDIRRMTVACGRPQDTLFRDDVAFCCDDIRDTLMLVLKATDCSGNMNFCMMEIYVQDKNPMGTPECPGDTTLNCSDDYLNPEITGNYYVVTACLDTIHATYQDQIDIDSCQTGSVTRRFYLQFPDGSIDSSCTQLITVENDYRFDSTDIDWPADLELPACRNNHPDSLGSRPEAVGDLCGTVQFSYTDLDIEFDADSCQILPRRWAAYSACTGQTFVDTQYLTLISLAYAKLKGPRDTTLANGRDSCSRYLVLKPAVLTGCSQYAIVTNDFNGGGTNASGEYPVGITQVVFTATDSCGSLKDTTTVIVLDLENPAVVCKILFINMNPNDSIKLTARELLDDYNDNCTDAGDLQIAFSSSNFSDTCRFITCADLQTIPDTFFFTVFVRDSSGNIGSCIARVHVFDPNNHCTTAIRIGDVSGMVKAGPGKPMAGVRIRLEGQGGERITSSDGKYLFKSIVTNQPYTLHPSCNEHWTEGISALDILMLQKHILGLEEFDQPIQWIAADVDRNGRLSGADISWMRRLILGKVQSVPSNESWRFVDERYAFTSRDNPLAEIFPEHLQLQGFWQDTAVNFRAVKVGDISGDTANGRAEQTTGQRLRKCDLLVQDKKFARGDVVYLDLRIGASLEATALQLHLVVDPAQLEMYQVEGFGEGLAPPVLNGEDNHFDGQNLKLLALWGVPGRTLVHGDALARLVFRAKRDGSVASAVRMGTGMTNELWQTGDVPLGLLLRYTVDETAPFSMDGWVVEPNPFSGKCQIRFESTQPATGSFYLFDVEGKLIFQREWSVLRGHNVFEIRADELPGSGTYVYAFHCLDQTQNGVLVNVGK
ncbi:MAG: hypothetical protein JPMHGGIA_00830 [Saprospiraceae bacterium]|jgi:hypothetical protein|nr:hypothetical protein [Saprospiraceae bacterium]